MGCELYSYDEKYGAIQIGCDSMKEAHEFKENIRKHFEEFGKDDHLDFFIRSHTQIVEIWPKITVEDVHNVVSKYMERGG